MNPSTSPVPGHVDSVTLISGRFSSTKKEWINLLKHSRLMVGQDKALRRNYPELEMQVYDTPNPDFCTEQTVSMVLNMKLVRSEITNISKNITVSCGVKRSNDMIYTYAPVSAVVYLPFDCTTPTPPTLPASPTPTVLEPTTDTPTTTVHSTPEPTVSVGEFNQVQQL